MNRGVKKKVWADSAYTGKEGDFSDEVLEKVKFIICEKGTRGHPLTEAQKKRNRVKSHTQSRVAHVFGFMTNSMHGITMRCIGMVRAKFNIAIMNLFYNMCRMEVLVRQKA